MTTDEQLAAIRVAQFFTDVRTQMQAVHTAMMTNAFSVQGQIAMIVAGVPVVAEFLNSNDVRVTVGQDEHGNALYEWTAPIAWVS